MRSSEFEGAPSVELPAATSPEYIQYLVEHPEAIAWVAQPIVDLRRGSVVGYEMLARFTSREGQSLLPVEVFEAASFSGYGAELEAVCIERALGLAVSRPPNCFISINVDPHHIDDPPVRAALDAHGDLAGIVFELTEQRPIYDLQSARRTVEALRRRGAMIAIDDGGAGYAELTKILELHPQILKLDRQLVFDVDANEAKRTLIHMLGELAGRLDAWVLAEGIETETELQTLFQLGMPLGQGFFLGHPAPPWAPLGQEALAAFARMRARSPETTPGGPLGTVLELVAMCQGDDDWPREHVSLRVDSTSRPIEMCLWGDDGRRLRMEYDLLRVQLDTSIAEVAIRAITRPEHLRWDPLVCINVRGQLEGIVPMQRILSALANAVLASEPKQLPDIGEKGAPSNGAHA